MIKKNMKWIYKILSPIIYKIKYPSCTIEDSLLHPSVSLGKEVIIKKGCKVGQNVKIGDYTYINEFTRIDTNTSTIGKYCSISHNVKIGMGPHPLNHISTSPVFYSKDRGYIKKNTYDEYQDKGYTEIGHDVFIAANAIIYAGVNIGTGSVIAAGSVVTKDVPPYAIVAGMPAKVLNYRFHKVIIEKLLKTHWWELDNSTLLRLHITMNTPEKFIDTLKGK